MKKTEFKNISTTTETMIKTTANMVENKNILEERKRIYETSPYSDNINKHITSFEELKIYCSLRLKEANVTRLSLIQTINPDMWVSCKSKNNRDLMLSGCPPYAFDDPDGMIELHHIGQSPDAPFAELTIKDHLFHGNNKTLHKSTSTSWRTNPKEESIFSKERATYWKKRGKGDFFILTQTSIIPLNSPDTKLAFTNPILIHEAIEKLYTECTSEELYYLSDLANSYAIIKEFGYHSIGEFVEQLNTEDSNPLIIQCGVCGSENCSRYGYYTNKNERIPRYKCNYCGRIFTNMDQSIISGSKFSLFEWLKFINCLYNGLSLDATAKQCHVSTKCIHENRLKIFYALKLIDEQTRLKGNIVIDETYFSASFKGAGTLQSKSLMNRKAHRRGSENHSKGLSKNLVCVVCAIDEYGNAVARIAGLGAPTAERIQKALDGAIDADALTCIYSDKEAALRAYAEKNGFPIKQAVALRKNKKRSKDYSYDKEKTMIRQQIQKINAFHSKLKRFLKPFLGVSSHLLSGYLCLFLWKDRHYTTGTGVAYQELMKVLVQPGLYKSVEEILKMSCFQEVTNRISIEYFKDVERAKAIYARYAQGEKIQSIADSYHLSRSSIQYVLKKFKRMGLAYKTQREILAEEKAQKQKIIPYPYKTISRNQDIYLQKIEWEGSSRDFYSMITQKHQLSLQTIKNIIALEERILSLKEEFFIYEKFEYKTLQEVYQSVYKYYLELKKQQIEHPQCIQILKKEFQYTEVNIIKIINTMRENMDKEEFFLQKKKIAIGETSLRDKALFVDFLKWEGSKKDFCIWATEKYRLSFYYIYHILSLNFIADPQRYENTYQRPTRCKE